MDNVFNWYSQLAKPFWAPPGWIFQPVWSFLYVLIAITFGMVFYKTIIGKIPKIIALPFVLNLLFNFAFTPLQFGLRNNLLALIDVILVFLTLTWAMFAIWSRARWIVYLCLPYLLWVSFASILQFSVTYLNW